MQRERERVEDLVLPHVTSTLSLPKIHQTGKAQLSHAHHRHYVSRVNDFGNEKSPQVAEVDNSSNNHHDQWLFAPMGHVTFDGQDSIEDATSRSHLNEWKLGHWNL